MNKTLYRKHREMSSIARRVVQQVFRTRGWFCKKLQSHVAIESFTKTINHANTTANLTKPGVWKRSKLYIVLESESRFAGLELDMCVTIHVDKEENSHAKRSFYNYQDAEQSRSELPALGNGHG